MNYTGYHLPCDSTLRVEILCKSKLELEVIVGTNTSIDLDT